MNKGDSVKISPATDWWMRGATIGVITSTPKAKPYVYVQLYQMGMPVNRGAGSRPVRIHASYLEVMK